MEPSESELVVFAREGTPRVKRTGGSYDIILRPLYLRAKSEPHEPDDRRFQLYRTPIAISNTNAQSLPRPNS
jgi:hypothetical protein